MSFKGKGGSMGGFQRQRWVHGWVSKTDDCIVFVSVVNAKRGKGWVPGWVS